MLESKDFDIYHLTAAQLMRLLPKGNPGRKPKQGLKDNMDARIKTVQPAGILMDIVDAVLRNVRDTDETPHPSPPPRWGPTTRALSEALEVPAFLRRVPPELD